MAKTEKCPHCGETKDPRHKSFCSKNPSRRKGTNIQQLRAPKQVQAAEAPQIVAKVEAVKAEALPNFTPPAQQPQKGAAPNPAAEIPSSVMVMPLVNALCGAFNKRLDFVAGGGVDGKPVPQPPDPVSEDEKQALAQVYGALADKWFPVLAQKWGVEIACVIVTVSVFGPRILDWWSYRAYQKKLVEAKKEAAPDPSGAWFQKPQGQEKEMPTIRDPLIRG